MGTIFNGGEMKEERRDKEMNDNKECYLENVFVIEGNKF